MPVCLLAGLASLVWASRPTLKLQSPGSIADPTVPFASALANVLDINTVPYDAKTYNRTGLLKGGLFLRAGGGYSQPWTRDASINSWNAASLLEPSVARDTLLSVTVPGKDGPIVQPDNQWWDKVIWVVGAWNHYLLTGDREFLTTAYGVSSRLLQDMKATRFNREFGLYEGPSFFNDGIAGYPAPPAQENDGGSSFVLDHKGSEKLMCLSTNCLYVGAYRAAAAMARELHARDTWSREADRVRDAINRRFWMPDRGLYGYLIQDGKLDPSEEGAGLAFSILFDVASPSRARSILAKAHVEPYGITDVYPHFPRFNDAHPGRHNAVVWPMVQGMWARAAAHNRDCSSLELQLSTLGGLAKNGHFFEIYNAKTGVPDGGWQNGHRWGSEPDQTWSASAYLSMVLNGVFGMRFGTDGLRFEPLVPKDWDGANLLGVPYRNASLDVQLFGFGSFVTRSYLDSQMVKGSTLPANLSGHHEVQIFLSDGIAPEPGQDTHPKIKDSTKIRSIDHELAFLLIDHWGWPMRHSWGGTGRGWVAAGTRGNFDFFISELNSDEESLSGEGRGFSIMMFENTKPSQRQLEWAKTLDPKKLGIDIYLDYSPGFTIRKTLLLDKDESVGHLRKRVVEFLDKASPIYDRLRVK